MNNLHAAGALPLFDGHNDALSRLQRGGAAAEPGFLDGDGAGDLDLPRAVSAGLRGGLFAIFVDGPAGDAPLVRSPHGWSIAPAPPLPRAQARPPALAMLTLLHRLADRSDGRLALAGEIDDVTAALTGGPLAAVAHLEGAEPIDPVALDDLWRLRDAGLRSLGLVWSRPNAFGHGVPFRLPASPDSGAGLTAAGRALVRECAAAGVLVDLAHLNACGVRDVAELIGGARPLVASHTTAHALTPSARALTDDQLRLIGATGGLVGISFSGPDLAAGGGDGADVDLDRVAAHAEHVAEQAGAGCVALGSDFDGASIPPAIGDVGGIPRLLDRLRERGWSEPDLRAFAHGNWLRVLERWWEPLAHF